MYSSDASCSDCKIEFVERRWTQLLLKWINKCVTTKTVTRLNPKTLADIMAKYNKDICSNDIDRAMLCTDDVEPFIKYKYPILRLRYFIEASEYPKRLYILTTIVLYHCCMNSQTGAVDEDICRELSKYEQELILKFCENLCEMEATVNNIESAIRGAFESVGMSNIEASPSDDIDTSISSDTVAHSSSESTIKGSIASLTLKETELDVKYKSLKLQTLNFNSSITVLPSVMVDTSTFSDMINCDENHERSEKDLYVDSDEINAYFFESGNEGETSKIVVQELKNSKVDNVAEVPKPTKYEKKHYIPPKENATIEGNVPEKTGNISKKPSEFHQCQSNCDCNRSTASRPCCGDPGNNIGLSESINAKKEVFCLSGVCINRLIMSTGIVAVLTLLIVGAIWLSLPFWYSKKNGEVLKLEGLVERMGPTEGNRWQCKNGFCQKVYHPYQGTFSSYSRCSLICIGPQLWPYPIGIISFSKTIVTITTKQLEYKFNSIPSEAVRQYLAGAFKIFIKNLARLEKGNNNPTFESQKLPPKKIYIQIDVESDPDPRLRLNTEETYDLKIETVKQHVKINIASLSFCGVRHGLETLSQLLLSDHSTGMLITLSHVEIKDGPSYKYRGLMIDTGRNYIPVSDLMRTIDAMATVKLNTFHWRISDATSFPLLLSKLPQLFQYGAYDSSMVYTEGDVKNIVHRAGIRGIRVLIEVAAPGPVGRPWSWTPDTTCPFQNDNNYACDNLLCMHIDMKDANFDILQTIYEEILNLTKVDDVFHLSDGVFSIANCLADQHDGFLDKALARLKQANRGFMPKLPIVWYTKRLRQDSEAKTWERLGVQVSKIDLDSNEDLTNFKVIHSSEWDLSCEMVKQRCRRFRTWQEMYSWKNWRNTEVFTIEGGEAVLWTDLVHSGNLDYHLWPRAAAVAERLWSDFVINVTATSTVYVRLDSQRWRMMFHGVKVRPVWPAWCSSNPGVCLQKLQK